MDRIVYCSNIAVKVYLFVCSLSFLYSWLKLTSVQINHKFKKILVAIDGSQESINAAEYAISNAKETTITAEKNSSELILLHVMPSEVRFGHASGIFGVVPPEHAERMKQEAHKWFEKIRDRMDSVVSADTLFDSYVIFSVLYYLLFVFICHFTDTNLSQLK